MSHRTLGIGDEVEANRPCTIEDLVKQGTRWDLYKVVHGGRAGLLKISVSEAGDDLVANEALTLVRVRSKVEDRFHPYFPVLFDIFDHEGRQAVVTEWLDGFYTMQEVIDAYPKGVDLKDMAWMFRRLFVALGAVHRASYLHGAVVPTNVLLHPEMHGLVLTNWSYAVPTEHGLAKELPTRDDRWDEWYPDAVKAGGYPATVAIDTLLAARTLVAVCAGDPVTVDIPGAPREFRAIFQACFGPRIPDAWELKIAFDELIEDLWGPKKFRPFTMPARQNGTA